MTPQKRKLLLLLAVMMDKLHGDKGERGEKGDKGDAGPQGPKGDKGDKGDMGPAGIDGLDGKDGKDGQDGDLIISEDAIQRFSIEILGKESSFEKKQVELLKKLLAKEYPTFAIPKEYISKEGRIRVEVDRAGGGGGGYETVAKADGTRINPATEEKQNSIITAIEAIPGGGGVQYTEGDIDATVTGTALMLKSEGNTMVTVSELNPLPVLATIDTTGLALESKQLPDGHNVTVDNVTPIPVDITQGVDVQFGPGTIDSFGHLVTGTINNQVDIQFYRDTVANLTTVTTANGGSASATGGMATFSATTTASSRAQGVSPTTTTYTAGGEIYAIFTAGWTGTGAGTSYQRIGIYDTNNGFFISKEANTFYATVRKGGADVGVAKASFSEDDLTGGATSQFTRNGTPEAIDLTKLNVFRIRFGWVGSAPINFEVLAPDGHWVTFHKIKQPNNAALPHINSADLPVTCDVNSGNGGNALTIITNCWAAGTTQALGKISATITDESFAGLQRAVITGETTAGGGGFVNVKVDPSGAVNVAGTVAVTLPNEGQQTMANSISVAIASNQTGVPVTGTFYQATQPVSGTVTATATDLDIRNLTATDVVTVTGGAGQTADVKVTLDGESVPVTGTFWQATQPVSGTFYQATQPVSLATNTPTLQANSGVDIGDVTINNASGASAVNIQDGGNTITVDGTVTINAIPAGNNNIGDVDIASIAAGNNNIGDVDVASIAAGTNTIGNVGIVPRTTGGLTTYHLVSAGTTNATVVKASAGQLFGWYIYNSNAAARKVAFHNTASAPTAGASIYFTLMIPPSSGANVFSDIGIAFSSGIAITTVTGLADSDAVAVAANDLIINLWYS